MTNRKVIVLSPVSYMENEAAVINDLFQAGIHRYHLAKIGATEQGLAEILQDIDPKYLSKITLHTHYHLVLAYGVGGIHYEEKVRLELGLDFIPKVELYQSFGIQVSSTYIKHSENLSSLNYIIIIGGEADFPIHNTLHYHLTTIDESSSKCIALSPEIWDSDTPSDSIISLLNKK